MESQQHNQPGVETRVIKVDPKNFTQEELADAVQLIKSNEVVAFPTETVYGLGANALSEVACQKIFQAKRRPSDNPLIIHISSVEMLSMLVAPENITPNAQALMQNFWPGPLTLLLPAKPGVVPPSVNAGLDSVAVRMPSHEVARQLIAWSGVPIAAPSANSSGRPSPTCAEHVRVDLSGRISLIVDDGRIGCEIGVESTVVDVQRSMILRPGGVTLEQIAKVIPDIKVFHREESAGLSQEQRKEMEDKPATPGMKYKHYSPDAKVILFDPHTLESYYSTIIEQLLHRAQQEFQSEDARPNLKIGIVQTLSSYNYDIKTEVQKSTALASVAATQIVTLQLKPDSNSIPCKTEQEQIEQGTAAAARGLFGALRDMDRVYGVQLILVEGVTEKYSGLAVMNRLRKASSETVKL